MMKESMNKVISTLVSVGVVGAASLAAPALAATPVSVTDAELSWGISRCAHDTTLPACGSLTGIQQVSGNATKTDNGYTFVGGSGTVDPETGATSLQFSGSVTIGNTTRGNYSIRFVDPMITVAADGAGALVADVTYTLSGAEPVTSADVPIVELANVPEEAPRSVTPTAFTPQFIGALAPTLQPWFQPTGSGADPFKVPSSVSLAAALPAPVDPVDPIVPVDPAPPATPVTWTATPTLTVTGAERARLDRPTTVTVKGTGFDPAVRSRPGVSGMYVVFGPNAATTPGGYGQAGTAKYFSAQWLPAIPNDQGEFTVAVEIQGAYTDEEGKEWNATTDVLGVSTWAAHGHVTTAWDSFQEIEFSAPVTRKAESTTTVRLRKATKRPGSVATATVRVAAETRATGKVVIRAGHRQLTRVATTQLRGRDDGRRIVTFPVRRAWAAKTVTVKAKYRGSDTVRVSVAKPVSLTVRR